MAMAERDRPTRVEIRVSVDSEIVFLDGHREPGPHTARLETTVYDKEAYEAVRPVVMAAIEQAYKKNPLASLLGFFGDMVVPTDRELWAKVKKRIVYHVSLYTKAYFPNGPPEVQEYTEDVERYVL